MDHVAIMRRSWGLTRKILTGEKRIESRWYRSRRPPWGKIGEGDAVYFKDSGFPVSIKSEVGRVLQFSDMTPENVREVLEVYREPDGIEKEDVPRFFEMFKDRRYCILIFLKNVEKVEPFEIDKRGFGAMSSWITVSSIDEIRKSGTGRI